MLHVAVAIPLVYVNGVIAALLAGRSRGGRALAVALTGAALGTPYLLAGDALGGRFFTAMAAALVFLRAVELVRLGPELSPLHRAVRVVAYYDTRKAVRVGPRLELRALAQQYGYALLGVGGLALAMFVAPQLEGVAYWTVRWLGGATFTYCLLDSAAGGLRVTSMLLGYRPPPLHDRPILSRSVAEFWGSRWNTTVSAYLRSYLLWPLARRRLAALGVVAAFALSGLLHAYMVLVALGWTLAGSMMAFFLLQIAFVAVERKARIRSWPAPVARAWTVAVMLAASPLFCEPGLRIFDPLFA